MTLESIVALEECASEDDRSAYMCTLFGLDPEKERLDASLLDFYVMNIKYATLLACAFFYLLTFITFISSFGYENNFNREQVSSLFSIMKVVFEESRNKNLLIDQAFDYLKELLVKHSVQRPPYSVGIFSVKQVNLITEFATETFFRHYKLYKAVFSTRVLLDFSAYTPAIETATVPPALTSAIEDRPPTPPQENEEEEEVDQEAEAEKAKEPVQTREEVSQLAAAIMKEEVERLKQEMQTQLEEKNEQLHGMLEQLQIV